MMKINPYIIIILVLIGVIIFQRSCSGDGDKNPINPDNIEIIHTDTVIKYNTIYRNVPEYIPKYYTKIEHVHDTVLSRVDTTSILEDYFSTYVYKDTQELDSLNITITDSITENKIKSRAIEYKLIYPTQTITNDVLISKNELYVGLGIGGNKTEINYFGPEVLLKTKKRQIYGVGVGVVGPNSPNLHFRTYWRLGKK